MNRYIEEFGEGYIISQELLDYLANNGWEDTSHHTDPCPNFEKNFHLLWVEFDDPTLRERFKKRYTITLDPYKEKDGVLFETDDVNEIIKKLKLLI